MNRLQTTKTLNRQDEVAATPARSVGGAKLPGPKVLIAAGGTGGHIYPCLAIAKEIVRRAPAAQVRFVGTPRGMEARIIAPAGFDLTFIEVKGLVRVGLTAQLRGLSLLPKGFLAVRRLIREFAPDVVVGGGSYVSGPVVLTAAVMGIPTLVMEAHVRPGITNRILARVVDKAAVWYESALPYFHGKAVMTGNPVRREFFDIPRKPHHGSGATVLVYGGSQAAHAINEAVIDALAHLEPYRPQLNFIHETGAADYERVLNAYRDAGWEARADVRQRIDNMPAAYAAADVIVCRAGASTCAELAAAGRAAILIPFPFATDDHQRQNAKALQQTGAACIILQHELTGERLAQELSSLLANPDRIEQMEDAGRKLARPDAAAVTVELIEQLIQARPVARKRNA